MADKKKSKQIFLNYPIDNWEADWMQFSIENSSEKQVDLFISSVGGSVNAGLRMAAYIQAVNAQGDRQIDTHNLSNADSIATAIFLAPPSKQRHILEHSTMFIHEPRLMFDTDITEEKAEKTAEKLAMQKERLADFYVKNIENLTKDEAFSLMAGEVDLTATMMLEKKIVQNISDNFEIAAIRADKNFINQNKNQMALFGNKKDDKQETINMVALADGKTTLAFAGELAEGVEMSKVGEVANLKGEHLTNDNRKLVVDENNKIVSIENIEASTEQFDAASFADQMAQAIVDSEERMATKFADMLKNMKLGDHRPGKNDGPKNERPSEVNDQVSARKTVRELVAVKIDVEKARKNQ